MADLHVELYGVHIGNLAGSGQDFDFTVERAGLEAFGLDSQVLSVSIPLGPVPVRSRKSRRRNFFSELLPEGRMLNHLAAEAGVPETDAIGLLRRFGRDVAGALQIWDPDVPGEPKSPRKLPVTDAQVAELLTQVQKYPVGNMPGHGKSSLAGVQDKIVLDRDESGWNQVLDGYPSSHILKPVSAEWPTVIYDEEYGSRIARAAGLAEFDTHITEFAGVPALVLERFDRSAAFESGRVHQEDFSQALGLRGSQKYQRYGGSASLGNIATILKQINQPEALKQLFRMVVLAVAVGNLDMHAKNLSLLHYPDGSMRLAPAYDVVPQVHQKNDGEMAMSVAGEYRHAAITGQHLLSEAETWGLPGMDQVLADVLGTVEDTASTERPHANAHPGIAKDIGRFTANLLAGQPAGQK